MKCNYCNLEMSSNNTNSCNPVLNGIRIKRQKFKRVLHTNKNRCHDCNIAKGGAHHFGCDVERCPQCNGQLISCLCGKTSLCVINK